MKLEDTIRVDLIGLPAKGALGFDPSAVFSGFGAPRDAAPVEPDQAADTQEGDNGSN